jgi:hypothetical protein
MRECTQRQPAGPRHIAIVILAALAQPASELLDEVAARLAPGGGVSAA